MEVSIAELKDLICAGKKDKEVAPATASPGEEVSLLAELIGRECIIRTRSAGVFLGKVAAVQGTLLKATNARRLWFWKGAASLSQLAIDGPGCPSECKFPAPVDEAFLPEVIEVIPATKEAVAKIGKVKIWET